MDGTALSTVCKWWRKRCREEELLAPRNSKPNFYYSDESVCPASKVVKILELKDAKRFLNLEEQKVNSEISKLKSEGSVTSLRKLIELSFIQGTYFVLMKKRIDALKRLFIFSFSNRRM